MPRFLTGVTGLRTQMGKFKPHSSPVTGRLLRAKQVRCKVGDTSQAKLCLGLCSLSGSLFAFSKGRFSLTRRNTLPNATKPRRLRYGIRLRAMDGNQRMFVVSSK